MAEKSWVLVDFGECPNCGNDAEIMTDSDTPNAAYDGDEVRCCECHYPGGFCCDAETPGFISWSETPEEDGWIDQSKLN